MEKTKIKIALVSYSNTLPYIAALDKLKSNQFELLRATPANCVRLFQKGEADVALIPLGALSEMSNYDIIPHYGIACNTEVRTVKLLSKVPIERIQEVHLDEDSRTSRILARILLDKKWNVHPDYFVSKVSDPTAGYESILAIGDKVFQLEAHYKYQYDLGEAWYEMTGLPFVFAIWISRKQVDKSQVDVIMDSFKNLDNYIGTISAELESTKPWIKEYLTNNIEFRISENHAKGMSLYLSMIEEYEMKQVLST